MPTGEIVAGGNRLLLFDGDHWTEIELPGGHSFRGLATDDTGRLWVGGSGQLGRLQREPTGGWKFLSLLALAQEAGLHAPFEILDVAVTPHGIIFVAPQQVLRWRGAAFDVWNLPCAPNLSAHRIDQDLLLHQPGVGLHHMTAVGPVLLIRQESLPPGRILWTTSIPTPERESPADGLVVGTNDGVYRLRRDAYEPLPELSQALAHQRPTCAVRIDDQTLAVGTLRTGIVIVDLEPPVTVRRILDRRAGLVDDRVNTLIADRRGGFWVGCSLGPAHIESAGTATLFDRRNGLTDGPLLRVFGHSDTEVFSSTSKTIYRLVPRTSAGEAANLHPLATPNTFLLDAVSSGRSIFASGFGGVWRLDTPDPSAPPATPGIWHHIYRISADVLQVVPSRSHPDTLFFLEGRSLSMLRPASTPVGAAHPLVADLGATPVSLLEDAAGDLWVSLMSGVIHRYRLHQTAGTPPAVELLQQFAPGAGMPPNSVKPRLSLLGNHLVAFTETAVLWRGDGEPAFLPIPALDNAVGIAAASNPSAPEVYWIIQPSPLVRFGVPALLRVQVSEPDGALQTDPLAVVGLEHLGLITSLNLIEQQGRPILWVGGTESLLRIERST